MNDELDIDQLSGDTDDANDQQMADEGNDVTDELNDGEPGDGAGTDDDAIEDGVADAEQAAADKESDGGVSGSQTVPLAVLLDERRNFQERIDTMNQNLGKFEALQTKVDTFMENKKAEEEAVPDPEYLDDPKAYVDHQVTKAEKASKETADNVTEMRESHEAQARMQQINARLGSIDADFVKDNTDYYEALEHVRRVNIENGMDMGMTEQQAGDQAARAIMMTQAQVMQKGINPAEYMYKMAKRWGYKTAAAADDKSIQDKNDDAIIAGQEADSMGGGAAPDTGERDEDEMSDSEFAEIMTGEFGSQFVKKLT